MPSEIPSDYRVRVLADSIAFGVRLTTLQARFPRFILAEVNTHRALCLAGDSVLEFDLPKGAKGRFRRVHRMRLDEFVDKWLHGARRYGSNPKRKCPIDWVDQAGEYSTSDAAARMGMSSAANLNRECRDGTLLAKRGADGRTWMVKGADLIAWRNKTPSHTRFDIRARLSNMRIRQLNEDTGDIQWSHVVNACESGQKEIFEVIAGDYRIAGSLDHRVLTIDGWKPIGGLKRGDSIIVRKFGKKEDDKRDPKRLIQIDGVWRSRWQRNERQRLAAEDRLCRRCRRNTGVEIHHIVPVHQDPSRALDRENVTLLCGDCHDSMHVKQGWQGETYLYGATVEIEDIVPKGCAETFDLEIDGRYPNFIANGVVVHNSRNSASSRAIPVEKRIAAVRSDPFIPHAFGKNQRGMQSEAALGLDEQLLARQAWLAAASMACDQAALLGSLAVHKQWASRLLEPFLWHEVIISATDWSNFFHLRINPQAQPEFQFAARAMKAAMDASTPVELGVGDWHLPLVDKRDADLDLPTRIQLSVARCARVSYLTHDGRRDVPADITLYEKLKSPGHMSPFEHPATVVDSHGFNHGNFRYPWVQARKLIPNESDILSGDIA